MTRLRLDLNSKSHCTRQRTVPYNNERSKQQVAQHRDSDYSLMQTALSACAACLIGEPPETFARKAKGKLRVGIGNGTRPVMGWARKVSQSVRQNHWFQQFIRSAHGALHGSTLCARRAVVRSFVSWHGMRRWTEHARMMPGLWSQYSREIS
jgi:hypothetical protein